MPDCTELLQSPAALLMGMYQSWLLGPQTDLKDSSSLSPLIRARPTPEPCHCSWLEPCQLLPTSEPVPTPILLLILTSHLQLRICGALDEIPSIIRLKLDISSGSCCKISCKFCRIYSLKPKNSRILETCCSQISPKQTCLSASLHLPGDSTSSSQLWKSLKHNLQKKQFQRWWGLACGI